VAICDECFEDFAHPIIHELMEKNRRFDEVYGGRERWDWDDKKATLKFSDPEKSTVLIDVAVVGSVEGNSWEWSWANKNYEGQLKIGTDRVRAFGEEHGYSQLTSSFVESDEFTGWKLTAIAAHILDAPGAYRFPTEDGHVYLVYRTIHFIEQKTGDRTTFQKQSR